MTLATWNMPAAEAAVSGLASPGGAGRGDWRLQRLRPEACAAAVLKGQADVALVPTTMVLQGASGFDVIPDTALSSWKYPFARLVLKEGLAPDPDGAFTLACDRRAVQERFVATVVLREHYQLNPEPALYSGDPDPRELLRGDEDAALVTAADPGTLPDTGRLRGGGGLVMDLGQEWFELVKYPMVWGLFVAREDTLDPETALDLQRRLHAAEQNRARWAQEAQHPDVEAFFRDGLRLRYDDMVLASLTELKHYLFYDGTIGDVPDLSFAELPEEEEA